MEKIAFIKAGGFSHINDNVFLLLQREFPENPIVTFDILDLVKLDINDLYYSVKQYGKDIALGRKRLINCMRRNTHYFQKVKQTIADHLSKENYLITFQTQSLFDASVPNIPHFIYTDHTHLANLYYPGYSKKNLYSNEWIQLEKSIYDNASAIFSMSSNISKSLVEQYGCEPNRVICAHAGSNTNLINFNSAKYKNKNILFVGLDWERKGGPFLVKAFNRIIRSHNDASLTIVGCSPNLRLPNCNVVGKVKLEAVPSFYENASVFCLQPSIEPFGIVFLEAASHKLPLIGTNIGAMPDFIINNYNGYLIDPGDEDQLFVSLNTLLSNPQQCENFGRNSYRIFETNYTWERTGNRIKRAIMTFL